MSKVSRDQAWGTILDDDPNIMRCIDSVGYFDLDAATIKQHMEPRLACKVDFRKQIPKPLAARNLSVLSIKNGLYRLARTDPFLDVKQSLFDRQMDTRAFTIPEHIEVLSINSISSESKALDAAYLSGMLDWVFEDSVDLVIRGRERAGKFRFSLPTQSGPVEDMDYDIEGTQLEVDGGYEGRRGLYLIEAKTCGTKSDDNINLRQLLYPQLHYAKNVVEKKFVKTYALFYEHGSQIFHFLPLSTNFSSRHVSTYRLDQSIQAYKRAILRTTDHEEEDLWTQIRQLPISPGRVKRSAPFPQADDFEKIYSSFKQLAIHETQSKTNLFLHYNITERQYAYYGNVLIWLGLADLDTHTQEYTITNFGKEIRDLCARDALFRLAEIIFSEEIPNLILHERMIPSKADWGRNDLSPQTRRRRAGTIKQWVQYFRTNLRPRFV